MDEAQKQKLAKVLTFKANPLKTFTEENEKVILAIEEIDSQLDTK